MWLNVRCTHHADPRSGMSKQRNQQSDKRMHNNPLRTTIRFGWSACCAKKSPGLHWGVNNIVTADWFKPVEDMPLSSILLNILLCPWRLPAARHGQHDVLLYFFEDIDFQVPSAGFIRLILFCLNWVMVPMVGRRSQTFLRWFSVPPQETAARNYVLGPRQSRVLQPIS
jgi:hypothetical protein